MINRKKEYKVLLEYSPEQGLWHFNTINNEGRFCHEPNTNGWYSIAYTLDWAAWWFQEYMALQHEKNPLSLKNLNVNEVKRQWRIFSTLLKCVFNFATDLVGGRTNADYIVDTSYNELSFAESNGCDDCSITGEILSKEEKV